LIIKIEGMRMKRKRRWIVAYRCNKYGMNILERAVFCKEKSQDRKCVDCEFRGNEDGLKQEKKNDS